MSTRQAWRREALEESALAALAGELARRWQSARVETLLAGLRGELGAGKTTFVRAMLRGLGYAGRVPSPTYTLLEEYSLGGLRFVHLDLYRLGDEAELEALGVRDWLGRAGGWTFVEWPERSPKLATLADLLIALEIADGHTRSVELVIRTDRGLFDAVCDLFSS